MRRLAAIAVVVAALGCRSGASRGGAGVGEACSAAADCAAPLSCDAGRCTLPQSLQACTPGARACDGDEVTACDALGLRVSVVQSCPAGCRAGACLAAACDRGARRCGTAGVEACTAGADGLAWVLAEPCASGCDETSAACRSLACKPLDVRCAPGLQACAADGSKWIDRPCLPGSVCHGGACVQQRCAPGALFCDGNLLSQCDATGGAVTAQTVCAAGCTAGACNPQACAPGVSRCSAGGAVERCLPDGSRFAQVEQCPGGQCRALSAVTAACAQPVCAPLARRCNAAANGVEVCLGDGSAWAAEAACSDGCSNGACLAPPAGCAAGAQRCAGSVVQRCDGAAWTSVGACPNGCSGAGVCSGASCSAGFALSVPLAACATGTCRPPADGSSSLLAIAGPILDALGAPVPDGTLVTVSADSTSGAQVLSADADPAAPGVQVRARNGKAVFAFRAPPASALDASGAATATLSAAVEGTTVCAATTSVSFGSAGTAAYFAEDFTTAAYRDLAATSADWQSGRVRALGSDLGDGRDGAFAVPPGANWDLTAQTRPGGTTPFGAALRVTAVGAASVSVEGAAIAAFQPGDEALLIELQGATLSAVAAAGSWELLTVASASGAQVSFTSPVLGAYGELPGAPLAGQRVVLQRVPHFTDVTVPAGSALTAAAWDGQKGGVVAFRASGRLALAGAVHADALGFRGGDTPDALHGQPGESFGGFAPAGTGSTAVLGGGGGGYGCGDWNHLYLLDTWWGSGGSYGGGGASDCGAEGVPYGAASLSRIFPGSGSGSQDLSTHQSCTPATCPGESTAGHGAVNQSNGGACASGNCADTLSACTGETVGHGAINRSASGACVSGNCADTLAACAPETVGHGSASQSGTSCGAGNCGDTFAACGPETVGHGAATLPCNGNAACTDTFNSCAVFDAAHGGYAACAGSCPGLVSGYSCNIDGCNGAAGNDAGGYGCNYAWNGGTCGGDGTTGFWNGCGSNASNCPHGGNDICTSNCNIFGGNCDCYFKCFGCATCTGCQTNPGCQTNVGCTTNVGCQTNPGCQTCAACDMTRGGTDCAQKCPNPWQQKAAGGRGGGVVFVAAGTLDLSGGGRISAAGGAPAAGNRGGSGGSVYLKLGALRLAAAGVQISAAGAGGGGAGRVRIDRGAGDDPVARGQVSPLPGYQGAFTLPQAQSRTFATHALSATLLFALDTSAPAVTYAVSGDGFATASPIAPGGTVTFGTAATDVRWRALLFPQKDSPAEVDALLWLLQ